MIPHEQSIILLCKPTNNINYFCKDVKKYKMFELRHILLQYNNAKLLFNKIIKEITITNINKFKYRIGGFGEKLSKIDFKKTKFKNISNEIKNYLSIKNEMDVNIKVEEYLNFT